MHQDSCGSAPGSGLDGSLQVEPGGSHGFHPARFDNNQHGGISRENVFDPLLFPSSSLASPITNGDHSQIGDTPNSQTTLESLAPKRGRPKGSSKGPKPVAYGPRPRLGHPPGTGHKQQQKAALLGENAPLDAAKRRRGRPRKIVSGPSRDLNEPSNSVIVKFGKVIVPGTNSQTQAVREAPSWGAIFRNSTSQGNSSPPNTTCIPTLVPPAAPPTLVTVNTGAPLVSPPESDYQNFREEGAHIIPEEDPQHAVESLDDDETSEAVGDGIGDDEEEEIEDDDDDEKEGSNETTNHRHRKPLPPWLLEEFQDRLKECRARDANNLPSLYANQKTFWFPQKSAFFCLREGRPSPVNLYERRMFLWDPQPLTSGGIPCPNCGHPLQRHCEIPRPRRCVDINSTFWIIGYRYRCNTCINPKTNKRTITFRSWNPRILKVLPPSLAAEFPARITHRSALSSTAFEWMRSCFQNGMGSKQFSDALRIQHLLRYDRLRLQYYTYLCQRRDLDSWRGEKYEVFLSFDDVSLRGRHGYIPGAQLLRELYNSYIEKHQHDFNQHTAMLTAEICAIDHSHKVQITKHLARVDGEQVFTGLLTVTNEKGEIQTCNLVATKAHSQSELALTNMEKSLNLYGHSQPEVFFTDNMSDKGFLERCFPSLRHNVVPIEKYGDLDIFQLPPAVTILPKDTTQSIDNACRLILDDVPHDQGCIAVGFDTEWNVELSPHGYVSHRGKTAIIQIAYRDIVYIFQVSEMISKGELPHQLKLLLSHSRILKIGRMVHNDLTYLQQACQSSSSLPFVGGLDLGKYAKDRHIISNITKTGLADLCALVLHLRLGKNVSERISDSWENSILSTEQLDYAAKDAYVSLQIYEKLSKIPVPSRLPPNIVSSMPVLIYSTDNTTVIGEGQISSNFGSQTYDGIKVSATRTVVDVLRVLVPGAIVTTHRQRPLNSFGKTPFSIICLRSHLRLFTPLLSSSTPMSPSASTSQTLVSGSDMIVDDSPDKMAEVEESEASLFVDNSFPSPDGSSEDSVGALLSQDLSEPNSELNSRKSFRDIDPSSASAGANIIGETPATWDDAIHSRVLKDIWHVFHMFYISATHGLRKPFTRELRDAIFIPDKEDKARINAWGSTQTPSVTYESLQNSSPAWLRRRCKHIVPPPQLLYHYVENVFRTYGPIKDPTTQKPLFSADNWKTAKNILDLIRNGYLSDPPGVALYTVIGVDKKAGGLPIYRCARGTNSTEGGVHTHIRSRLPKFGVSIRHVQASLMDFVLRHNLLTGTYNTTGQHYRGHFSIWITNRLQELLLSLNDVLSNPAHITGWVNTNLYSPTTEVLGILPIPENIRASSQMLPFNPIITNYSQKHQFLAKIQGARKPILPIHTVVEKKLFRELMNSNASFSPVSGEPRWQDAVKVWNTRADFTDNVSYKLVEQLKTYYTKWKTISHVSEALSLSASTRNPLSVIIHDPRRSEQAPPIPVKNPTPHSVDQGMLNLDWTTSYLLSHDSHARPNGTPLPMETDTENISLPPASAPTRGQQANTHLIALAERRIGQLLQQVKPLKPQRTRHCRKCGEKKCSGNQGVKYCKSPCRDCKKVECIGRNSKRPKKKCTEGWY